MLASQTSGRLSLRVGNTISVLDSSGEQNKSIVVMMLLILGESERLSVFHLLHSAHKEGPLLLSLETSAVNKRKILTRIQRSII